MLHIICRRSGAAHLARILTGAALLTAATCAPGVLGPSALAPSAAAMDNKVVQKDGPDLTKARALIKAKDWSAAITELEALRAKGPNADVFNLLGFSNRKLGKFDVSYDYYQQALKLDPNHKSAHEYLGELYIQTNRIAKAREQQAILVKLCPKGCEEREDLEKSLAAATKK